jgi:hypothetical protein
MNRKFRLIFIFLFSTALLHAQKATINEAFNKIDNGNLFLVFEKLNQLKIKGTGRINIVHIGDSHIYANVFSAVIRDSLHQYFGNAGAALQLPQELTPASTTNDPGICYYSIAQNGARFLNFIENDDFWKKLPALKADLYIVSLGTNESQYDNFTETVFRKQMIDFLNRLQQTAAEASLIITTPAASFKGGHTNKIIQKTSDAIFRYCTEKNMAIWDLYRICNGLSGAGAWYKAGYLTADGVHFSTTGYQVQGKLFYKAFMQSYFSYIR